MENFQLKEVSGVTDENVKTVQGLLNQLTSSPISFTKEKLQTIIDNKDSHLYFFQKGEQVYGMITTGSYEAPTGRKTWIEDVVVDEKFRGAGLGRKMLQEMLDKLSLEENTTLMLTSNPKRIAANALYKSLGFTPKETNVYKMEIKKKI